MNTLVIKTYCAYSGPRSAPEMRKVREGGRRSGEVKQEATLILKLLHLSASPAATPDVQEPSAPVVLSLVETSRAIRIQLTKTPGTGC